MFLDVIVMFIVCIQSTVSGYIEKVEASGCESCRLMLACRRLDAIIAILDVDFKAESPVFDTGLIKSDNRIFPPDHPRDALNKRCSGLNVCSFILTVDSPGSEAYGSGLITVKYACATPDRVQRYCNSHVTLDERSSSGIVHNPGYPRFYAGQLKCVWKIDVPPYQRIKLRFLDVALFDTVVLSQEDCKDTLEIRDSGQTIFSTCSQEHPPSEVISASESVEIVLTSRQMVNPKRGVLIYYTVVRCPTPSAPPRSRLVFQNGSLATYECCEGLVFPDTRLQTRTIKCLSAEWNISLPLLGCERPEAPKSINLQEVGLQTNAMVSELVAPVLLMVLLFVLNGFVVFYIHKARKKQVVEVQDEELGTFTQTNQ